VTGRPDERLVLVVGAHRSGTTWLQQLLLAHPSMGGQLIESRLFIALRSLWQNVTDESATGLAAHLALDDAIPALQRFTNRALDGLAADRPGAVRVIEKTPAHSLDLPCVAALHPGAWVVHLVRDGRDVVRSALELDFGADDAREAARQWRRWVETVRRDLPQFPRHREIRYEALLSDPVTEVVGLLEWSGLTVDGAVRDELERRAGERVSQYNTTGAVGSGKWRRLSAADQAAIEDEAGELLRGLGYHDG